MRGLWVRFLRGGGRSVRLEVGLPVVAAAFITLILSLILGLQHGLALRADRTAWRTPERASEPSAIQAGYTDYVGDRTIAVVELAAVTTRPPNVPGTGGFPATGEVWVSPALADLMRELPRDQLADRFPANPSALLGQEVLEHPDELVAVIGRDAADPLMRADRPPHQWNEVTSVSPTEIDSWSSTPDLYQAVYGDLVLIAAILLALPLLGLGGLAARLVASRRQRRLATLRLIGATSSQAARMAVSEVAALAAAGAVMGAVVYLLFVPVASRVVIKGGAWFPHDLQLGLLPTAAVVLAVVSLMAAGSLLGLRGVVRDPLGVYRRSQPEPARAWSALVVAVAVLIFWTQSADVGVSVVFTATAVTGWCVLTTGPWLIAGLGRLLARGATKPATLLAGRRLADNPRGGWRTVSGIVLAAFISGFLAVGIPVGIGFVEMAHGDARRLLLVVPAAEVEEATERVVARLDTLGIEADARPTAPPSWNSSEEWAGIELDVGGTESEQERARTAVAMELPGRAAVGTADESIPNLWLLRDGSAVGALVLGVSILVALTSMVVGAIARIFDQRDTLIALRLAGTPLDVLASAQRREMMLPSLLLGGVAAVAGVASGSVLGTPSLINPVSAALFLGLVLVGVTALVLADRLARPVLEQATADLSERE